MSKPEQSKATQAAKFALEEYKRQGGSLGYMPGLLTDCITAAFSDYDRVRQDSEMLNNPATCHRGHKSNLPFKLWDCPDCTEEIRNRLHQVEEKARGLAKSTLGYFAASATEGSGDLDSALECGFNARQFARDILRLLDAGRK